jgi:hypothetical protein
MGQDSHEHLLVLTLSEWASQSEEESTTLQLHLKASMIIAREGI